MLKVKTEITIRLRKADKSEEKLGTLNLVRVGEGKMDAEIHIEVSRSKEAGEAYIVSFYDLHNALRALTTERA